jgi:hypothetical protein
MVKALDKHLFNSRKLVMVTLPLLLGDGDFGFVIGLTGRTGGG